MCDRNKNEQGLEIVVGLVTPIGSNKSPFIQKLKKKLKSNGFITEEISVVELLITIKNKYNIPESLKYYLKMQILSKFRYEYSNAIFVKLIIEEIQSKRKSNKGKKVVYIIDQLKNISEYRVLSHVYGLNYIQISLFSSMNERDDFLKVKLKKDQIICKDSYVEEIKNIIESISIKGRLKDKILEESFIESLLDDYYREILPDASHKLMKKDFIDLDRKLEDRKSGQQISELFHKSHYFMNLDLTDKVINDEISKLIALLMGDHSEFPTQDEFGMSLSYQASVRSNFPGNRQIGAAIISKYGEVLSVASIRAPSSDSTNPSLSAQGLIQDGYEHYCDHIKKWRKSLLELSNKNNLSVEEKENLSDIEKFLRESIDFHPCTHAEIAAILDAAKIGVSVRDATLYTTTFPCHLCAKDIINSGIDKVVYLEAYPKSKNRDLYPDLIDFDPKGESTLIPFKFYCGVGPKRFTYVYSWDNKANDKETMPLLKYEVSKYYSEKENDIILHLNALLDEYKSENTDHLKGLLNHTSEL